MCTIAHILLNRHLHFIYKDPEVESQDLVNYVSLGSLHFEILRTTETIWCRTHGETDKGNKGIRNIKRE